MKHLSKRQDYSIRPDDEISKLIDQVEDTINEYENSLHSIAEEKEETEAEEEKINKQMIDDLGEKDQLNSTTSLIKSSTKANLYPNLLEFKQTEPKATGDSVKLTEETNRTSTIERAECKSPTIIQETVQTPTKITIRSQNIKPTTPMRTLSQYRREQKQRAVNNATPSTITLDIEKARLKEEMENARSVIYQDGLKKKVEQLRVLIEKYEKGIEQSSNALALCLKNPDQRGSSSQLAAEQILLLSTQRRTACKEEIEKIESKLKSPVLRVPEVPLASGSISIERIFLPLKSDFIVGQVNDQDPLNHHFICLATCGERVLETELLDSSTSIQNAAITFELNKLLFEGLDKDFEILFELYGMALSKEKHHHDKKSSLMSSIKIPPLSPKLGRSKKAANQMITYSANQGFTRLGYIKFNWNNILNQDYELEEFMYNSPFTGQIQVELKMNAIYNTEIELEDFLNEYDGKYWKSRYYVLRGYLLAYWQYKEDYTDRNQPSLGTIDLRNCVNRKIGPVSLNVCPRSHSFVLVIEDEILDRQKKSTKDNKVHKTTEQRSLIFAADSKEDFDKWCEHLNKLLPMIRVWEYNAKPPQDLKFLEQK